MRNIIGKIIVFTLVFLSSNLFGQAKNTPVYSDSVYTKAELDSVINDFVQGYLDIKNKTVDAQLAAMAKDPYETTSEFEKRKKQLISDFNKNKISEVSEYYKANSKRTITAVVEIDSVHYDADMQIAKLFHLNINIPNNRGIPKLNAYVFPPLKYPLGWKTKEGFGLEKTDVRIERKTARENDIIKNKGTLEYVFKFFREGEIPALRVQSIKWQIDETFIWTWTGGNTRIPNGIYNKPLKGVL